MITIGQTITLRKDDGVEHIYFVIGQYGERFLLVNATTFKSGKVADCILDSNDHPFLRHKSIINYGDALDAKETVIDSNIKRKISRKLVPINKKTLTKIIMGALTSKAFSAKYRSYLSELSQPVFKSIISATSTGA